MIDALMLADRFVDAGLKRSRAEDMARAIKDTLEENSELVTKADLAKQTAVLVKWFAGTLILQAGVITAMVRLG